MKIETIKDLEKIIRVCRKAGVDIIKLGDIEIVLGKQEVRSVTKRNKEINPGLNLPGGIDENTRIEIPDIATPDELSDEQLMFYSTGTNETAQ